jgi:large subunit ribosomal protein L35
MANQPKRHKGAAKRLRLSGSSRLLRRHSARNHFLSKKRSGRKRLLAHSHELDNGARKTAHRLLGR